MSVPDDAFTEAEIAIETDRVYRRHYLMMLGGILLTGLALIGYILILYTLHTRQEVLALFVEQWPLGQGNELMVWGLLGSQTFMMAAALLWCIVHRHPDDESAVYAAVKRLTDRGGLSDK